MSKEVALILLGLWTALVPYLGLPGSWRTILLVVTGLGIAALGFFLRRDVLAHGASHKADHFVDNRPREEVSAQPQQPYETQPSRSRIQ